ncbi:hypothetical protein FRC08_000054 [Ceratobasidium sp. 394]|nr:hypothetical protein FRC08_000054 [Ceratobasidium sp. 394]
MPMVIEFDDKAIKFLLAPPKPSRPLRDIMLTLKTSPEIVSLARMGRDLIRSCASARTYTPPISEKFDFGVDNKVSDNKLASVAERCGLLQRLNVDGVAIESADLVLILCAYLGAAFRCAWKEHGVNTIHSSINDLCSLILNDDDEPAVIENNSHERMMGIPGVEKVTAPAYKAPPPPSVSAPTPTRGPQNLMAGMDVNSNDSVSSGPVPTSSPAFMPASSQSQAGSGGYQQPPYQQMPFASSTPQGVSPQPSNMAPGGWPSQPPNPPGYAMPTQPPPSIPMPPLPTQQTQGFISLFNELAMKNRMITSWQQQKTGQQHIPEWTMWLIVDGTPRGHGTAPTKQAAKEIAAKAALQAMGWLAA